MFFLRKVYLDPPTVLLGLPRYTFFVQIVLPTAPYCQSGFFHLFPTLTWY